MARFPLRTVKKEKRQAIFGRCRPGIPSFSVLTRKSVFCGRFEPKFSDVQSLERMPKSLSCFKMHETSMGEVCLMAFSPIDYKTELNGDVAWHVGPENIEKMSSKG